MGDLGRITGHMLAAHSLPLGAKKGVRFVRKVRSGGEEIPAGFRMVLPNQVADDLIAIGWCCDPVTGIAGEPEEGIELEVDAIRQELAGDGGGVALPPASQAERDAPGVGVND